MEMKMKIENAMEIARQMAAEADFEGYIDVYLRKSDGAIRFVENIMGLVAYDETKYRYVGGVQTDVVMR